MTTNTSTNPYDGKDFLITTPEPGENGQYGSGYLAPADGSLPPARIAGAIVGTRYHLDPQNTGRIEDYVEGPIVGDEILGFIAKRGGEVGRVEGDVAPWSGWGLADFTAPLAEPVVGHAEKVETSQTVPAEEHEDASKTEFVMGVGPSSDSSLADATHFTVHRSVWEKIVELAKRAEADAARGTHFIVKELAVLRDHFEHHQHEELPK